MTTARRAKDVKHTSTGHARHSKKITVLMAEDNAFLRRSLCTLLDAEGHIKVIGQARNGREAVVMANNLQPDVILMDISMPVLNGLQATRQILTANPQAKVVILSIHSDDEYIECMTMVGAVGYLEKQTATEILPSAIHEVFMGHRFYSTAIAKRMANRKKWSRNFDGLLKPNGVHFTARETKVLRFVAEGLGDRQIAATLGIDIKAVKKHRQQATDKLNIHESADLIRYAV